MKDKFYADRGKGRPRLKLLGFEAEHGGKSFFRSTVGGFLFSGSLIGDLLFVTRRGLGHSELNTSTIGVADGGLFCLPIRERVRRIRSVVKESVDASGGGDHEKSIEDRFPMLHITAPPRRAESRLLKKRFSRRLKDSRMESYAGFSPGVPKYLLHEASGAAAYLSPANNLALKWAGNFCSGIEENRVGAGLGSCGAWRPHKRIEPACTAGRGCGCFCPPLAAGRLPRLSDDYGPGGHGRRCGTGCSHPCGAPPARRSNLRESLALAAGHRCTTGPHALKAPKVLV